MTLVFLLLAAVAALFLAARLAPETLTRWALAAERAYSGLATRSAPASTSPISKAARARRCCSFTASAATRTLTRVARFLTPHYHVIIPDLPGFGDASRDPAQDRVLHPNGAVAFHALFPNSQVRIRRHRTPADGRGAQAERRRLPRVPANS